MKHCLLTLFTLLAALTGCSQGELPATSETDSAVEIYLGSLTGNMKGTTRAPMQGSTSPAMTARVLLSGTSGAYTSDTDGANRFYDGTMTFNGSDEVGFNDTKQYYPSNGSEVYVCGLFPATGWAAVSATSTTDYTLDGKTDVMAACEVSTKKTDGQGTPSYKTLAFNHLLTNLIIKAKADGSAGAPAAARIQELWGNITGLSLIKAGGSAPKSKVTVTLKEGSAATATAFSGSGVASFYKASGTTHPYAHEDVALGSVAIPATETAIAYSLIAPIAAKGGLTTDLELLVKTVKEPAGVTVPLSLSVAGDTQGKYCEVTLTFKLMGIKAEATIAAWGEGGTASGELQ